MRAGSRTWLRLVAAALPLGAIALACSSSSHPGPFQPPLPDTAVADTVDPGFDARDDAAPLNCSSIEADALCACEELGTRPTLIYLLLDRSGSMRDTIGDPAIMKWRVVVDALLGKSGALRKLGSKIRIGVTNFPSDSSCGAGVDVFGITQASTAVDDDIYTRLRDVVVPGGGTPTAAAVTRITPIVRAAEAPVAVLIATDGGPNCDAVDPCTVDQCINNIEGACPATINCCDPNAVAGASWSNCLDGAHTVTAVQALRQFRIPVYVLGVPGAAPYATILDQMAVAGGTDHYYDATDGTQAALLAALDQILAKAIDSCTIVLEHPPTDPGTTNVLVDGVTVPKDPIDGWSWGDGNASIALNGASCAQAKTATHVQVAVGCKTVTR